MTTLLSRLALVAISSFVLTGCVSSWYGTQDQTAMMNDSGTVGDISVNSTVIASGQPLGGYLEQYMDNNDKVKMGRGLDGAIGKATTWTNPVNGAKFTVTPIRKVNMEGARYCRTYNVIMTKQSSRDQVSGTACIGQDGIWHVIG